MKTGKKAMVIGLDGVSIRLLERFINSGDLPNLKRFAVKGSLNGAIPEIPAYTPTNWATIITGARPGSHGAINWTDRGPGKLLNRNKISTFDSRAIACETIWEAAERKGLTNLIMAFPASFPAPVRNGYTIAPFLPYDVYNLPLKPGCLYSNVPADKVKTHCLTLQKAHGWQGADGKPALEAVIYIGNENPELNHSEQPDCVQGQVRDGTGSGLTFNVCILNSGGQGYDRIIISKNKSVTRPLVSLQEGQWSSWLIEDIPTDKGFKRGSFRFKVLHIDAEGKQIQILISEIYPVCGFTHPEWLAEELIDEIGPYIERAALETDIVTFKETVFEEMSYQIDWYLRVAQYMTQTYPWDLLFIRWNFPDTVLHQCLAQADPQSPVYEPDHAERHLEIIQEVLQLGDRLIGGLTRLADKDTYTVVLSDHGNSSNMYQCDLVRRLEERQLMKVVPGKKFEYLRKFEHKAIDWAASKVYPLSGHQICVNLKGREHQGIVGAEDYAKVQDEIIDALYDWRSSDGRRPVALALKKKDAQIIGYWGENAGDVIFVYAAGYSWIKGSGDSTIVRAKAGANHGPQIPTAATDFSNNLAFMAFKGPKIKRGYKRDFHRDGYMRLIDLVPTLCYLMELDVPDKAQGCVLYDLIFSADNQMS